jgi:uncharacterized membrane protein YqjE
LDGNEAQQRSTEEKSLGELVTEVSENASVLVREEIELARAEIEQKVKQIARGAVAGAVAGVFLLFALIYLLEALAWGLDDLFWGGDYWAGFLAVGVALVLLGIAGGLFAMRSLKSGAPPTPEQAIEEARLIKEAIEHPEVQAAAAAESAKAKK